TTEAPCRTIRHATSRMSGGDTVIVHAGTYEEHGIFMPNGSSSAPSTLKANPGDTVLLRWGGARQAQMIGFRTGANWQVVDGFVMDGVSHQTDGSTGISFLLHAVDNGSNDFHNITVQNNDIKNGYHQGALLSGDNWRIVNNRFHDNGTDPQLDHGGYFS